MKPTPAQRRVLTFLRDHPDTSIEVMQRPQWRPLPVWSRPFRDGTELPLASSTFGALLRNDWVAWTHHDRQWDFYALTDTGHAVLEKP